MNYSSQHGDGNPLLHQTTILIEDCDTGQYQYATVYNSSAGSLYCGTDIAFKPGTSVKIKVANQSVISDVKHYQCEVTWCRELNGGSSAHDYGLGVRIFKVIIE